MEEFKRQTILEYDLPPLGYDEALAFTLSILQGEVTPAQAFESLDPRQTSRNLE